MTLHSAEYVKQAVETARQLGTRPAAKQLGLDPRELRSWRREANRAQAAEARHVAADKPARRRRPREQQQRDLDELEQRIGTVTDLGELQRIQAQLARLARELKADPERCPIVALLDDEAA